MVLRCEGTENKSFLPRDKFCEGGRGDAKKLSEKSFFFVFPASVAVGLSRPEKPQGNIANGNPIPATHVLLQRNGRCCSDEERQGMVSEGKGREGGTIVPYGLSVYLLICRTSYMLAIQYGFSLFMVYGPCPEECFFGESMEWCTDHRKRRWHFSTSRDALSSLSVQEVPIFPFLFLPIHFLGKCRKRSLGQKRETKLFSLPSALSPHIP